jgi:uncharacterized protein
MCGMKPSEKLGQIDPIAIIRKYYSPDSLAYSMLVKHSEAVTTKAVDVARRVKNLNPDIDFIKEAAMLHDIGIFLTNAPEIGCFGDKPYICHGYLGRELLEKEGLPRHALVCERHIGVGMTEEDIKKDDLPVPLRDMSSQSLEEEIVSFADKFFSKNEEYLTKEKSIDKIKSELLKYGENKVKLFEHWLKKFGY